MRKLIAVLPLFILTFNTNAQSWLDIGLKGGYGLHYLINKNIQDDPEFNQRFSAGYNFGGKLGFNINDFHEVTGEVLMFTHEQKYKYNTLNPSDSSRPEFDRSIKYKGISIAMCYRHNQDARYVEIGPQISLVNSATGSDNSTTGTTTNGSSFDPDKVKENLAKNYFGMVFGFGGYIMGTENFGITMGVRLNFNFTDLIGDAGQASNVNYPTYKTYTSYTQTKVMTAMFVMEANLDFAFMAKAKCKNKRKLILF